MITSDRFPGPRFRNVAETKLSGTQRTTYKIEKVVDDAVLIKKHFELKTGAKDNGEAKLEVTGDGMLTFDTSRGAASKLDFEQTLVVRGENVSVRIPMTISCPAPALPLTGLLG